MHVLNIEYNNKECRQIVLSNILLMLHRRKLISEPLELQKTIEITSEDIYTIPIDMAEIDNKIIQVYFVNSKITSINQGSSLDEFLSKNIDVKKIVIFKEINKKIAKQIYYEYTNAEFFREYELLEDIPQKDFIPEHQLLTVPEKEELLNKFPDNTLQRIFSIDIMVRYYNGHVNDIFRIISPSITSGKSIRYRKVIATSNMFDILFSS